MRGQSRSIGAIFEDRLRVAQEIAAENVEHLRLSQIASGLMVLDLRDEEDGMAGDGRAVERGANFRALQCCMDRINALEAALKALDGELQSAVEQESRSP